MTDVWGANTFPVRKYNSRAFHIKVRRSRLFRFFWRFPQIKVGGDSARIPFMEHASRESRVALPPKGRLRQLATPLGTVFLRVRPFNLVQMFYHDFLLCWFPFIFYGLVYINSLLLLVRFKMYAWGKYLLKFWYQWQMSYRMSRHHASEHADYVWQYEQIKTSK